MEFKHSLGEFEYWLIGLFFAGYMFFFLRIFLISRTLPVNLLPLLGKFLLRTAYFSLIIIALLGPYKPEMPISAESNSKANSKDIYLLLDLSKSMDVKDVPPSRLERTKYELGKVINEFSADRIGLIIFASDAFSQCPITYDKSALSLMMDLCSTDLVPQGGTDIGKALDLALQKHKNSDTKNSDAKLILLVSDGEDFGDNTVEIAKEIKAQGIKLFTLGIGTSEGGKIPSKKGFKKDETGEDVISVLNRKPLKKLAQLTNGKYFEINKRKSETKKLIQAIQKVKGTSRDLKINDKPVNYKFHWFLIVALLLISIDVLISLKVVKI